MEELITKYNFTVGMDVLLHSVDRLTNQIWKLIPMREHEENWEGQIDKVLIELIGLNEILNFDDKYLNLLANLEGLKITHIDFFNYRRIVFESISLLRECVKDVERK